MSPLHIPQNRPNRLASIPEATNFIKSAIYRKPQKASATGARVAQKERRIRKPVAIRKSRRQVSDDNEKFGREFSATPSLPDARHLFPKEDPQQEREPGC